LGVAWGADSGLNRYRSLRYRCNWNWPTRLAEAMTPKGASTTGGLSTQTPAHCSITG